MIWTQLTDFMVLIWTQLTDFMVLILIAASVTEIIMGDFRSAVVLLAVVLLNVVIGFTQERKASNALEALVTLTAPQVNLFCI
jgi:Ca2+-transporting ATPase